MTWRRQKKRKVGASVKMAAPGGKGLRDSRSYYVFSDDTA
jgi:hypothetical protein